MAHIKIQNVLGVSFAEIDLSKIALIAGHNAAGKSSIVEATRAALTRDPMIRGVTKKNAAESIVKRGNEKGSIALGDAENWVRVSWPKATVEEKGVDVPRSSRVAAGIDTITGMAPKERQTFLHALLRAEPDETMFKEHLVAAGISEDGAGKAWGILQEKGWDVMHQDRVERGRRFKAQWEEVAVQDYGENKAKAWIPPGFDAERADLGEDDWQASIAKLRTAVELEVGKVAVSAAEWERKSALAGKAAPLRLQLDNASSSRAEIETRLQALRKAKDDLPPLPGDVATCPHCDKPIVPRTKDPKSGMWMIDKGPETLPSATNLKERRHAHESIDQEIADKRAALQAAVIAENALRHDCKESSEAEAWLEANPAPQESGESEELQAAREALRLEQVAHAAWKSKVRADEIVRAIEANQVLIKALAPDGLRRERAAEVVKTWVRSFIDPVCRAWDLPPITFDESLSITVGGSPYSLLAESEKYRVDVALQIATALQDGSYAIVIDRADVLLPSLRQKMFTILAGLERPAMVAMSARDQAKVPRLQDHDLGFSYWVASGSVTEIQSAAAA